MNINIFDLSIAIIILVFGIRGYLKGFVEMTFSLISIILGIVIAYLFYQTFAEVIVKITKSNINYINVISFILVFIVVNLIIRIIGNKIEKLLKKIYLGWANKIAGIGIGIIQALILIYLILIPICYINIPEINELLEKSKSVPYFIIAFKYMFTFLPEDFLNILQGIINKSNTLTTSSHLHYSV